MQLWSFFSSATSFRVRIALALKGIPYEYKTINLRQGEQHDPAFLRDNPAAGVPVLVDGTVTLGQSLAILDYLDQRYPVPQLTPDDTLQRARVLELVNLIAYDTHPVNNLRVQLYLKNTLGITDEQKKHLVPPLGRPGLECSRAFARTPRAYALLFRQRPYAGGLLPDTPSLECRTRRV